MYWWSREISDLRSSSIRARRLWQRSKRGADLEDILAKRRNYRSAKKALRSAIRKAKSTSWAELISSIETDPWGLSYKLVMRKLRKSSPTLSETLGEESLIKLLDTLFPRSEREAVSLVPSDTLPPEVVEDTDVSVHEVIGLVKKRPYRNAAPGPDNIKAAVWKKVPGIGRVPLAHGAIAHQPDSTRKIDTIPDSAPTR